MKILIIVPEPLFPTNSGGREDALKYAQAFRQNGNEVHLICFHHADEKISTSEAQLFSSYQLFPRQSFLKSSIRHPILPYQLSSRILPQNKHLSFPDVDLVIANQEWVLPLARSIAIPNSAPVILRRTNDELQFFSSLLSKEKNILKKMYIFAELVRLRLALGNKKFYQNVDCFADITEISAAGAINITCEIVPPILFDPHLGKADLQSVIVYFGGSLDLSHTLDGIAWFVNKVWPLVQAEIPEARLHISGRGSGTNQIKQLLGVDGVVLLGELESPLEEMRNSAVFINPVFSGSGINMKIGPPASMGIPIVTTSSGSRGLRDLKDSLLVCDDAETFALNVIKLLSNAGFRKMISTKTSNAISNYSSSKSMFRFEQLILEAKVSKSASN